jgi:hypothetical protein
MTTNRDLDLADQIGLILHGEKPDDQILALTACILRLRLHRIRDLASPDGQACVDRLIAAISPPESAA